MEIPDRILDYSWDVIKVYLCIVTEPDDYGRLLASWDEIADNVGMSKPDVIRCKNELEALGLYPVRGLLPDVSGVQKNFNHEYSGEDVSNPFVVGD